MLLAMDFSDLVRTRSSVRAYRSDPLPAATLDAIFQEVRLAPSAANRQPWKILLISSREWLDKVHAAYPRSWFMEAPHVVVVTGALDRAWQRSYDGYNSLETDLAILMDHLILAAWNHGAGTCWIANFEPDVLRRNLGLGPEERVFAMTPLGLPVDGTAAETVKDRRELAGILLSL